MALPAEQHYTAQQYLALERAAETKSELVNGRIFAMAGTSRAHALISTNVLVQLAFQTRNGPCEVYNSDLRVKVSETGMYTYPDVSVACGDIRFDDAQQDTLTNPTVIVEVLSPSTEAYDRGDKFAHYRRLPSLTDYLLIAQDQMRVEQFARRGEEWVLSEHSDAEGSVELPAIGCALALRDIYARVQLDAAPRGRGPHSNGTA